MRLTRKTKICLVFIAFLGIIGEMIIILAEDSPDLLCHESR